MRCCNGIPGAEEFVSAMNALTGAAVCVMIMGLGIYMVHDAVKQNIASMPGKAEKEKHHGPDR